LLEKETDELAKIASQEKYYPEIENQLKDLKEKIRTSKRNDLINYKSEISEILEEQIAFHYALAEGQAAVSLERDKTVMEARRVLTNTSEYKKILSVE
jgi:carboxyl-terminal processing protease